MDRVLGINAPAAIHRSPNYGKFFACSFYSRTDSAKHYNLFTWTVPCRRTFNSQISAAQPIRLPGDKSSYPPADRLLRHSCVGTRHCLGRSSSTRHVDWIFLCIAMGFDRPAPTLSSMPAPVDESGPRGPTFAYDAGLVWHRADVLKRSRTAARSRDFYQFLRFAKMASVGFLVAKLVLVAGGKPISQCRLRMPIHNALPAGSGCSSCSLSVRPWVSRAVTSRWGSMSVKLGFRFWMVEKAVGLTSDSV